MDIGKIANDLNNMNKGCFSKLNALAAHPEDFNSTASAFALYSEMETTNNSLIQVAKIVLAAMEARRKVATIVDTIV